MGASNAVDLTPDLELCHLAHELHDQNLVQSLYHSIILAASYRDVWLDTGYSHHGPCAEDFRRHE
jgi:hypothetical protein